MILGRVQSFLALEDERVEELLQAFIGEIDAKLLEGIHLEALESKNIQNADHQVHVVTISSLYRATHSLQNCHFMA